MQKIEIPSHMEPTPTQTIINIVEGRAKRLRDFAEFLMDIPTETHNIEQQIANISEEQRPSYDRLACATKWMQKQHRVMRAFLDEPELYPYPFMPNVIDWNFVANDCLQKIGAIPPAPIIFPDCAEEYKDLIEKCVHAYKNIGNETARDELCRYTERVLYARKGILAAVAEVIRK